MERIKINNLDTPFTIDTYQTFTFEGELEFFELSGDYDDYEWHYNYLEYIKHLAVISTQVIKDLTTDNDDKIILGISAPLSTDSPKFYNYATDSYIAEYVVNRALLDDYITAHQTEYNEYLQKYFQTDDAQNRLVFYIEGEYNDPKIIEDYINAVFENRNEWDFVSYTDKEVK